MKKYELTIENEPERESITLSRCRYDGVEIFYDEIDDLIHQLQVLQTMNTLNKSIKYIIDNME